MPVQQTRLSLRLLGTFLVFIDGQQVPASAYGRPGAQRLIQLLALAPEHRMHREQVLECLWPGLTPEAAASQLYKAVYYIRQAFRAVSSTLPIDQLLAVRNETLCLDAPGGVSTDLELFGRLAVTALNTLSEGDLKAARQAYRGDLLPTDLYEDWTLGPREQVGQVLNELLAAQGETLLNMGHVAEAHEAFAALLTRDAGHEPAHRGLMRVHAARGDRTALERQVHQLSAVLASAFGAEPSATTQQLYVHLAAQIHGGASSSGLLTSALLPPTS